jgi:hypothetical protein
MAMFSKSERDILTNLARQLEQTTLAITNLAGTTQDQVESSKELNRNFRDQRSALERDRQDVRTSRMGDIAYEAVSGHAYETGEDPTTPAGRVVQNQRRARRDEGVRISSTDGPHGGSSDIGSGNAAGGDVGDIFDWRAGGGGGGISGGGVVAAGTPDDSGRQAGQFTPEERQLRQRATILDSDRAHFARRLWFGNRPTTQQMAYLLSEQLGRAAFETQPDPNNPDERMPVYIQPGTEAARDEAGNLVRNQYGEVVGASDYASLAPDEQPDDLSSIQTDARSGIPVTRQGRIGGLIPRGVPLGLSKMLATGGEIIPTVAIATAALQYGRQIMTSFAAPGRGGTQMGYDPGFFGQGAQNYLGGRFEALRAADFGFNPWLSTSQALQINSAIEGIGYRGDQRNAMIGAFGGLGERGLNVQDFIQLFNADYRYGATNLSEFVRTMEEVPSAAQAANMNVHAFTQQLVEVSTAIAQRSGTSATSVAGQITAVSQATGMTPGLVGAQTNDQFLTIMGAANFGERLGTYLADPRRAAYQSTMGVEQKFQMLTGQPLQNLPTDPNLQALAREINFVQPNAFGMDIPQLMQYALDPNRNRTTTANSDLQQALQSLIPFGNGQIMMTGPNGLTNVTSDQGRNQLNERIRSDLQQAGVAPDKINQIIQQTGGGISMGDIQREIRQATGAVRDVTNNRIQNANAKASVVVGLDPRAQGILTTVLKGANYENLQNPNGNNSFWSDVGDVAGTVGGGLKDALGSLSMPAMPGLAGG